MRMKVLLCIGNSESSLMLLMNLEMLDFSNILNFLESVCWVDSQLVSLVYSNQSLDLISFLEVMVS